MNDSLSKIIEGLSGLFGSAIGSLVRFVDTNPSVTQMFVATIGLAGAVIATIVAFRLIRWAFRKARSFVHGIRDRYFGVIRRVEKNAVFQRMKGKFMAKWTTRYMADRFEDVILEAEVSGILSNQQGRRLRKRMAAATGASDLAPRLIGKKLRAYFLGATHKTKTGEFKVPPGYQKLAGPTAKFSAAGGPPGTPTPKNVVKSATLERMRAARSAA